MPLVILYPVFAFVVLLGMNRVFLQSVQASIIELKFRSLYQRRQQLIPVDLHALLQSQHWWLLLSM
jgi:hypothetical protein